MILGSKALTAAEVAGAAGPRGAGPRSSSPPTGCRRGTRLGRKRARRSASASAALAVALGGFTCSSEVSWPWPGSRGRSLGGATHGLGDLLWVARSVSKVQGAAGGVGAMISSTRPGVGSAGAGEAGRVRGFHAGHASIMEPSYARWRCIPTVRCQIHSRDQDLCATIQSIQQKYQKVIHLCE